MIYSNNKTKKLVKVINDNIYNTTRNVRMVLFYYIHENPETDQLIMDHDIFLNRFTEEKILNQK